MSNAKMIKLSGKLTCSNQQEVALVERYLDEHRRLTREESGCLSFDVTATADPLIWKVEELFSSKEAFNAHQLRTKSSEWGIQTRSIVREYQITELE